MAAGAVRGCVPLPSFHVSAEKLERPASPRPGVPSVTRAESSGPWISAVDNYLKTPDTLQLEWIML